MKAKEFKHTYKSIEFTFTPHSGVRISSLRLKGTWPYSVFYKKDGEAYVSKLQINLESLKDDDIKDALCDSCLSFVKNRKEMI